jgi:peptide/nickel transport system permease protein
MPDSIRGSAWPEQATAETLAAGRRWRWARRYLQNRPAVVGLAVLLMVFTCAVAPRMVSNQVPSAMGGDTFASPNAAHPMGTDDLGRDVLAGVVHGARTSLRIGFLAAAISVTIGLVVGAVSGFYNGRVDTLLTAVTEWVQVIPRFVLALLLVALWGATTWNIIAAIGILSWPLTARLARAEFLSRKEREFVTAARAMGLPDHRIMFLQILPNALPPLVVNASLEVGNAILLEAGMSFLGLGDPQAVSWGSMLFNAQGFFRRAWWMSVFPGVAIFCTVLSLNVIGDGLNQSLNIRMLDR